LKAYRSAVFGTVILGCMDLGCAMSGFGWRTVWTEEQVETTQLGAAGLDLVHVRTHNGRVAYTGSPDQPQLTVTITKKGGGSCAATAEAALAAIDVFVEPQGNGVAKLGWRWRGIKSHRWRGQVSFDIEGPAAISVDGGTHNGALDVRGVEGDVAVETHNGAVVVDTRGGRLEAQTHNGRITADYEGNEVNLRTHNGALVADLSRCGAVAGSMISHNGDIRVSVGDRTSAELMCRTYNGGITVHAPLSTQSYSRRKLTGVLGDGGGSLAVMTHNGGIRIKKAEG